MVVGDKKSSLVGNAEYINDCVGSILHECVMSSVVGMAGGPILTWKRPSGAGRLWKTFTGVRRTERLNLLIHEIPENRYDEALGLFMEHFIPHEITSRALALDSFKADLAVVCDEMRFILQQNISIGIYLIDAEDLTMRLIGMNLLYVVSKNDTPWTSSKVRRESLLKSTRIT